jgi:lipoprotein LprG
VWEADGVLLPLAPPRPRRARRTTGAARVAALVAVLPLALGACSGGDDDAGSDGGETPQQVVDAARKTLDDTTGLTLSIETDALPSGVTGITSATGEAAHPPAFTGTFDLTVKGFPAKAEVITVDGTTYAKNSLLLPSWTEIDPADYGAPDPTVLMTPGQGFSALVGAVTGLEEGDSTRGGKDNTEVLTRYTGTVPGDAVTDILPTATGDFDVALLVTDNGELREVDATGEFYSGADPLTYKITFDDYGSTPDISAP